MSDRLVIVLIRNPELGKVKTRLAKEIGQEKALKVYNLLLSHTQQIVSNVNADRLVLYSEFIDDHDIWNDGFKKGLQPKGGLGEKLVEASRYAFTNNYKQVVILGSDCMQLTTTIIEKGFEALNDHEFVIGPAKDGGYYLIGLSGENDFVFENMPWSTDQLFNRTIEKIENSRMSVKVLQKLSDVDEKTDIDFIY